MSPKINDIFTIFMTWLKSYREDKCICMCKCSTWALHQKMLICTQTNTLQVHALIRDFMCRQCLPRFFLFVDWAENLPFLCFSFSGVSTSTACPYRSCVPRTGLYPRGSNPWTSSNGFGNTNDWSAKKKGVKGRMLWCFICDDVCCIAVVFTDLWTT